jgi:hypothetical protein
MSEEEPPAGDARRRRAASRRNAGGAGSSRSNSGRSGPSRADLSRADLSRADPSRADPERYPPECYGPLGRDVGGFDNLEFALIRLESTLYVDPNYLPELDRLINAHPEVFERQEWELGMFYGHVITHTFLKASWDPPSGGSLPTVRIGTRALVEVMPIVNARLNEPNRTLTGNFAYLRRVADKYGR